MSSFQIEDVHFTPNVRGASRYHKVSYPVHYGIYSEIQTPDFIFRYNLNGDIKYLQGKTRDLTRHSQKHYYPKGTVYLSPLHRRHKREQLRLFSRIKRLSRRPTYLYLLQRL